MHQAELDRMRRQVAASPVIAKLQDAAHQLLGGALLVLLRKGDEVIEVHPSGNSNDLPEFCRLFRASDNGMECCTTCRSLMAFGTCYRGTIEYACHGGVIIVATPASQSDDGAIQPVIASCAFSRVDREAGWKELRDHAQGLGIDLRSLRAAYDRMPVLTDERRRIAGSLVEVAAAALDQQPVPQDSDPIAPPSAGEQTSEDRVAQLVESALYIAKAESKQQSESSSAGLIVEPVKELVHRDPTLPFTVKNIAAAAKVTPNYFSTVFREVTGAPFTKFLLEERITLAKQWLRDLTLRVDEVAKRSGFPDAGRFTRRFRQATGRTPTQWRKTV